MIRRFLAKLPFFTADATADVNGTANGGEGADEGTAPVRRQDITICRMLLALSVFLIFLFWGAYRVSDALFRPASTFADPLWGRVLFALLPATALVASYLSKAARLRLVSLWRGFLYGTVAWFTGLSVANGFAPAYTLGLLFIVAATSAGFGVGLRCQRSLLPFLAFTTLLPGGAAVWEALSGEAWPSGLRDGAAVLPVFLVALLSLSVIFYLILGWRVRVEQALQRRRREASAASRLKSSIIGNLSHELRTPLTSILGFAETLETELAGPPGQMAASIKKSGDRLRRTLEMLLALSSLEAGRAGAEPERVNLGECVEEAATAFKARAEKKGVDLEVRRPTGQIEVLLDPDLLRRLTSVLVDNAVKFTEDGQVTVAVAASASPRDDGSEWKSEETFRLSVEDSGIGIGAEKLKRLFDPFRQGSEGLDREHEGLGLGLSLVRQIVELLGGEITVESEKGKGTRVEVVLPRYQDRDPLPTTSLTTNASAE